MVVLFLDEAFGGLARVLKDPNIMKIDIQIQNYI